jgi:acyl-CoA synthetase (AMP-forming)/AMP-acid ligase II
LAIPTPSLRQLLSLGTRVTSRLHRLRMVMAGGAFLSPDLIRAFRELLPQARLLKAYGSSELGGLATKGPATEGNSVGKAVANTKIYILDEDLNPVPPGVPGEIYVSANHLARGYLNQPEMTADKFLLDPFSARPKSRILRTGDLGRFTLDGDVEFLGRTDDLVKVRGYRIYLAEVESVIREHQSISDLALAVREIDKESRIVAYVVRQGETRLSATELRRFLEDRLPNYMVPSIFVFVDSIPRMISGKADLLALPAPGSGRDDIESEHAEPSDPVESFLIDQWRSILGFDAIGINDHFLELGGDSVFASLVASRVWERFGIELEQVTLFDHPTIAEYAAEIRSRLAAVGVQHAVGDHHHS